MKEESLDAAHQLAHADNRLEVLKITLAAKDMRLDIARERVAELEKERNLYMSRLDAACAQMPRLRELEQGVKDKRIAELEAELQAFRDFNAPLLRTIAEEEPGAWDHLQGDAQKERENDG